MSEYYLGTLSGTSADGIDVALIDFASDKPRLVAANTYPMPDTVRSEVRALANPTDNEIERLGRLDVNLGRLIADAINTLLTESGIDANAVVAVGSHGQTLRHRPDAYPPFTLQIGDPNTITARTGIPTVTDFRRMDMALEGQGAPLAPTFHDAVLRSAAADTAILNVGGIANLTLLPKDPSAAVIGFDTGPGNCLMDDWTCLHQSKPFDRDGAWASRGQCLTTLLDRALSDPYFTLPAPKSSGREYFNADWLALYLNGDTARPEDVQATLLELTARSVTDAVKSYLGDNGECLVCGGGVHNKALMRRLAELASPIPVKSSECRGLDPDYVEAMMLAWLARERWNLRCLATLPSITGSRRAAITGALYLG